MKTEDSVNAWKENHAFTIRFACLLVLLGLGIIHFFDGWWIHFWASLLVIFGAVAFFFAHKIKKMYLSP